MEVEFGQINLYNKQLYCLLNGHEMKFHNTECTVYIFVEFLENKISSILKNNSS